MSLTRERRNAINRPNPVAKKTAFRFKKGSNKKEATTLTFHSPIFPDQDKKQLGVVATKEFVDFLEDPNTAYNLTIEQLAALAESAIKLRFHDNEIAASIIGDAFSRLFPPKSDPNGFFTPK